MENPQCPRCKSLHTNKRGIRNGRQRYSCAECNKRFMLPKGIYNEADILVFDIETAPALFYAWNPGKQYLGYDQIYEDAYILSWAAKWLCDDNVMSDVVTPKESIKGNDKRIIKPIWELLDKAQIVISQNGDRFDIGWLNNKFFEYDFNPPTPYVSLDILPRNRKKFRFPSYSQGYLTKRFGLTEKSPMVYKDWKDCKAGDQKALDKMVSYNRNDVRGLEDIYFKVQAWLPNHPNVTLYGDLTEKGCHRCGSPNLVWAGQYATVVNLYDTYRCKDCGGITRDRKSTLTKKNGVNTNNITGGMAI